MSIQYFKVLAPAEDRRLWYVINTRQRQEAKVEATLLRKNIETFLPKIILSYRQSEPLPNAPLFPGHLFVHTELNVKTYYQIINAKGPARLLGYNSSPVPVPPDRIESIRIIVDSNRAYYPWKYIDNGKQVRVMEGPLAGATGYILKKGEKSRLVVAIDLLKRSVAVELDGESIESWEK